MGRNISVDARWHVLVTYPDWLSVAWLEGPFRDEGTAQRHMEGLKRRKGTMRYRMRTIRCETPEAVCPCGEPNPPEYGPCTPSSPCSYAQGRIEELWA